MGHKCFPHRLAFMLNNPIRQHFNPPTRLISKLDIGPGDVVVDFGCGPGYFTVPIAKVAGKTIGIDVSSSMLEKAADYAKKSDVAIELIQSNGTQINLENDSVDIIVLVHVFHEIEERRKALSEFLRILRPSGRLLIVEKTRGGVLAAKFGPPIVNESEIVTEIANAGFVIVKTVAHGTDSIIQGKKP